MLSGVTRASTLVLPLHEADSEPKTSRLPPVKPESYIQIAALHLLLTPTPVGLLSVAQASGPGGCCKECSLGAWSGELGGGHSEGTAAMCTHGGVRVCVWGGNPSSPVCTMQGLCSICVAQGCSKQPQPVWG